MPEVVPEPVDVPIADESIKLGQLMKLANLVDGGSNAREVIERGLVRVDGVVETRRGAKVAVGSEVEFAGQRARIVAAR